MLPRLLHGTVYQRKIKLTLFRFHELPVGWHKHGVESQRFHTRYYLINIFNACGGRIAQLTAQNKQLILSVGVSIHRQHHNRQ